MTSTPVQTRRKMTLKEKIELIEYFKANKVSVRKLSEHFKIGKTQAGAILKQEAQLLELWLTNSGTERTRLTPDSIGYQIDKHVYEWYKYMVEGNMQVTGPMIQCRSREIATEMGNNNFKASNGWLGNFLKRHKIFLKPSKADEWDANEVAARMDKWRKHLTSVLTNYSPDDVLTADELGLFFNAFPERTKSWKHETCSDGKKLSQRRLTILLCSSMTGKKEDPLIIFRDSKLKNFNPSELTQYNVTWKCNPYVWMNRNIMVEWLKELDKRMQTQKRNVILFMDSAPSHRDHKLKNIKIEIFPPDISFYGQPMPNGIIQRFKNYYRIQLLRFIVSKENDKYKPATESIDIPQAIGWVNEAWKNVSDTFIQNCFKSTGFSTEPSKIVLNNNALSVEEVSLLLQRYGSTVRPTDYINIDSNVETEGSDPDMIEVLVDAHELNYVYSDTEEVDDPVNENDQSNTVKPMEDFGSSARSFDESFQTAAGSISEQNLNTTGASVSDEKFQTDKMSVDENLEKNEMLFKNEISPMKGTFENNYDTEIKEFPNTTGNPVPISTGNALRVESYSQALFHLKDLQEFYVSVMDFDCLSRIEHLILHNQKVVKSNNFYKNNTGF